MMTPDTLNTQTKAQIIRCPYCGWEYLPCEIFLPNHFFGKTDTVIRDVLGKIIYSEYKPGAEPAFTETYICDGCNTAFKVDAQVAYKSKAEKEELNFNQPLSSLLD